MIKQDCYIKEYFKNNQLNPKNLRIFFKNHNDLYLMFLQQFQNYSNFSFFYFIKFYLNGMLDYTCPMCGKKLNQEQLRKNKKYCSSKCSANTQQVKQKHIDTNLKKYGVAYTFQNENIKQKIAKTNLQRYGVENPLFNQEIKNIIKQKISNKDQSDWKQILQKRKKTTLQKHGVQHTSKVQLVKQKIKQTFLLHYNAEHPLKNKTILEKATKKRLKTLFVKLLKRIENYATPLFDVKQYTGFEKDQVYKWKCVKCGKQFHNKIVNVAFDKCKKIPRCPYCFPHVSGYSYKQKQLCNFIKQIYSNQILQRSKKIIFPYELDLYIPQKKIGIQFNGLYWHQDIFEKTSSLKKTQICSEIDVQLIHIFEDQWTYKQQIVKDRIKSILGIDRNRIFARKCIIKQISTKDKNQFLNQNHLQGQDNSKVKLGLYYQNQLISVMTFGKPRFNNNYQWQLIRFSSKLGYQVVGGAGKLLTYFQKNYHPKNLISYADRRYSNGKMYYSLGFKFLNNSEPNYLWYKNHTKYTRYQCQKHKLKNILGQNFNQQLSESQNMYLNGFGKIYDCGNMIFEKQY